MPTAVDASSGRFSKPLRLGVCGATGCLLAAVIFGEFVMLWMPQPAEPKQPEVDVMFVVDATASMQYAIDGTREGIQQFAQQLGKRDLDARVGMIAFRDRIYSPPKVDVVFVLDTTSSMQSLIDGVRDGIQDFASELESSGLDVQVGLIAFRDRLANEEPEILQFNGSALTTNYGAFRGQVSRLRASGGGDIPESSFDALALAARQQFRQGGGKMTSKTDKGARAAKQILVLITDAPPKIPDKETRDVAALNDILVSHGIDQLHLVARRRDRDVYEELRAAVPIGEFFDLDRVASSESGFKSVLPAVAKQIATKFDGLVAPKDASPTTADATGSDTDDLAEAHVLQFEDGAFTRDYDRFRSEVSQVQAAGGGDIPESSLDALALAARQPYRGSATKVVVLITDAPPHVPDREMSTPEEAGETLKESGIDQLHLVVMNGDLSTYRTIQDGADAPGKFFSLADAATGRRGFDDMLPEVGRQIAESIQGLQSGEAFSKEQMGQLIAAVAGWTAVLAAGLGLALIVGQNLSMRRRWLGLQEGLKGGIGGLLAGLAAGLAGQLLFQITTGGGDAAAPNELWIAVTRIVAWSLLGAALGCGMSFFIPNLLWHRGLLAGAIGGAMGGVGFLTAGNLAGDMAGRLLGAAILGFAIGLTVALAEMAFRSAWLEVAFGPKEKTAVTLGSQTVTVGSDSDCTVWVPGAAPVAYRYQMEDQIIFCSDIAGGTSTNVANGDSRTIGRVTVTVRTSTGEKAADQAPQAKTPAPPPPSRKAKTKPPPRGQSMATPDCCDDSTAREDVVSTSGIKPPPPPPRKKK